LDARKVVATSTKPTGEAGGVCGTEYLRGGWAREEWRADGVALAGRRHHGPVDAGTRVGADGWRA
ncbi:MAG: hypothetical protein WAL12_20855, partial [Trebonia sp.]